MRRAISRLHPRATVPGSGGRASLRIGGRRDGSVLFVERRAVGHRPDYPAAGGFQPAKMRNGPWMLRAATPGSWRGARRRAYGWRIRMARRTAVEAGTGPAERPLAPSGRTLLYLHVPDDAKAHHAARITPEDNSGYAEIARTSQFAPHSRRTAMPLCLRGRAGVRRRPTCCFCCGSQSGS